MKRGLLIRFLAAVLITVGLFACRPEPLPSDKPGSEVGPGEDPGTGDEPGGGEEPGDKPGTGDLPGDDGATVTGTVTCDGEPVAGVLVSDGYQVAETGADGVYRLVSDKKHGYVFITIPSGYEVPLDGIMPQFFAHTTQPASVKETQDFILYETDQEEYTLLVFGDMHLANRTFCKDLIQFREFAEEIRGLHEDNPDTKYYALTLGDMSWDYFWTANHYDLTNYLEEANRDFYELPIFHTMGNHDNDPSFSGNFDGESTYKRVIGPTYYSFNIGKCHYIVLDDIEYHNYSGSRDFYSNIPDEQLTWIEKDLSHVDKSTPVFVTMHSPLYRKDGSKALYNMWDLVKKFSGYKNTHFLTGHTHVVYNVDNTSMSVPVYENNSGAVCGAWWMTESNYPGYHLSGDGAPGGYRIFDVDGASYSWRFKGTRVSDDCVFRAYDRNEICLSAEKYVPRANSTKQAEFLSTVGDYAVEDKSNKVLINVWDYDPSWKITVKEGGKTLPVTQLKDVKDPLYLVAYEAFQYNNGYSISYPAYTTDHIFSVTASSATSTLDITVTDRFGRTFSSSMSRPQPFVL